MISFSSSPLLRASRALGAVALLGGAVAACAPQPTTPTAEPAVTATRTATPSPTAAAPLTPPGTTLAADEVLTVPMIAEDVDGTRTEVVAQLRVSDTVVGTIGDLDDIFTPAEVEELWYQYPVFITYTATISGPAVPKGFTITEPVSVTGTTSTGGQAAPVESGQSPHACPVMDTVTLSTTGTAEGCWTLIARYDSDLTGIEYRGGFVGSAVNYTTNPVTWEVTASAEQ